ncbi:hypothetical protein INR49_021819, partial [Caranx melampygus]
MRTHTLTLCTVAQDKVKVSYPAGGGAGPCPVVVLEVTWYGAHLEPWTQRTLRRYFLLSLLDEQGRCSGESGNIWLNGTALKSIRKEGKVSSLTVYPAVENRLTLQYGHSVQAWAFTVSPRTKFTKIRGQQKPLEHPTNATKGFLDLFSPTEVFACENGTLFFHQDEKFFLAFGHTTRPPIRLEARSPSMLLVSWLEKSPAVSDSHAVTLYHEDLDSYNTLSMDFTTLNHYHFTALDSCSPYVACVEVAGTQSFTCLYALTDPGVPKDFKVTSWNSSSISLAWDCPENSKYSHFLLTTFYLNGTDHITEEVALRYEEDSFELTLPELQPCSRVKFGLQTVCQAGMEPRYSKMVLNDGNSDHSRIWDLHQTSLGPDNYTLRWEVRNTSSISMFRVYHEGALQGSTLGTSYTVGGLQPCHRYQSKVEALCGDSVVLSVQTVTAHTGPHGVSELRYRSNDSTALWMPSGPQHSAVAFLYELLLENGTTIQSSRLTDSELRLSGLEEGRTYILDVWEECDGLWESEHSHLWFEGSNSSSELHARAAGPSHDLELDIDLSSMGLTMVVPWLLPADLMDDVSEPRAKIGKIFKDKLQELLKDFDQPARVELETFEPAEEPDKTEILFMSFDASKPEEDVPLPAEDLLDYIGSLNATNVTVVDGVIHWDGHNLCASVELCPRNSLCINTLSSFICVCQHGYYDISPLIQRAVASHPVCSEKGLYSQCRDKLMTGGIAKPYLTSYIGGEVDVNKTHIEFQNTLIVTLTKDRPISRRDLTVIWKCIYPRHYVRNAKVGMDMEWLSSLSLVEFNSSLQLALTMTLYRDESYSYSFKHVISLSLEDSLFFQVDLQTANSFASDVMLQVDSCWATESTNPQDAVQGVLLQDGCPVDNTFHWLSVNGRAQSSRFSIQMFTMPRGQPLYIHCLANICGPDEDCTKNCSSLQRLKRSVSPADREGRRAAVVSAGPLVVNMVKSGVRPSDC